MAMPYTDRAVYNRIAPKREAVLQFCEAEVAASRGFPSPVAISKHMGWKQSGSASDALFKLCFYDKAIGCAIIDGKRQYHLLQKETAP